MIIPVLVRIPVSILAMAVAMVAIAVVVAVVLALIVAEAVRILVPEDARGIVREAVVPHALVHVKEAVPILVLVLAILLAILHAKPPVWAARGHVWAVASTHVCIHVMPHVRLLVSA